MCAASHTGWLKDTYCAAATRRLMQLGQLHCCFKLNPGLLQCGD